MLKKERTIHIPGIYISLNIDQLWLQNIWNQINCGKRLGILSCICNVVPLNLAKTLNAVSSQRYQTSAKFSFPAESFGFFPNLNQHQHYVLCSPEGQLQAGVEHNTSCCSRERERQGSVPMLWEFSRSVLHQTLLGFVCVFEHGLPLDHLRLVSFTERAAVFPCGGGVTVRAMDAGS